MAETLEDLIALALGLAVLWFLVGVFSQEISSGDHRRPMGGVKGGSR